MDLVEYMLYLYQQEKFDVQLSNVAKRLLHSFVKRKICSTYQCYKDLKSKYEQEGKTITYKNVYKRIQKLYESDLIEKANNKDNEETKHGAIFYRLTSFGVFYMIFNRITYQKEIIIENKNDQLFLLFLYPYIKFKTIESLTNDHIVSYIFSYLSKCCHNLQYFINEMRNLESNGGLFYSYGMTETITHPTYSDDPMLGSKQFVDFLKNNLNITWVDRETTKIIEVEKNKEIKILDKKNELTLKIYLDKLEAVLFDKNRNLFKFTLEKPAKDVYELTELRPTSIKEYLSIIQPRLEREIKKNLSDLCLGILDYATWITYHKGDEHTKTESIQVLRQDVLFIKSLSNFKAEMDYIYQNFFIN